MNKKKPILQLLNLPDLEQIRIKDQPTNMENQNVELRHEINMAFDKIQSIYAHRFNGLIHGVCNQYTILQDEVDQVTISLEDLSIQVKQIKADNAAIIKSLGGLSKSLKELSEVNLTSDIESTIHKTLEHLGLDDKDTAHNLKLLKDYISDRKDIKKIIVTKIIGATTTVLMGALAYGVISQIRGYSI